VTARNSSGRSAQLKRVRHRDGGLTLTVRFTLDRATLKELIRLGCAAGAIETTIALVRHT